MSAEPLGRVRCAVSCVETCAGCALQYKSSQRVFAMHGANAVAALKSRPITIGNQHIL